MFHYERESRTPHSECYIVENESGSRGRVDLHFAAPLIYATLCVPESWSEEDVQDVIADVDDRLASSADPLRDDLIVTVWRGAEMGVWSTDTDIDATGSDELNSQAPASQN